MPRKPKEAKKPRKVSDRQKCMSGMLKDARAKALPAGLKTFGDALSAWGKEFGKSAGECKKKFPAKPRVKKTTAPKAK